MAGFQYVKDLNGIHNPLTADTVGATAIKAGDALIVGASQEVVIPATAATDRISGVALVAGAIGATAIYAPSSDSAIFTVITVATAYTDATHKYTTCDLAGFTSGAMTITPGADTNHQVLLLGLVEGETDAEVGNKVYCKIYLRDGLNDNA